MNAVKKAKKEAEKSEGELAKLAEEKARIIQTIESLKGERSAAVRELAKGDTGKRKEILRLESRIKDSSDFSEGLDIEINEKQGVLEKTRADLKAAEEEREKACRVFILEGMEKEAGPLAEEAHKALQEAADLLVQAQVKWGKAAIIESALRQRGLPNEQLFQDLAGFNVIVEQKYQVIGFTHLDSFSPGVVRAGGIPPKDCHPERRRGTNFHGEDVNSAAIKKLRAEFEARE